MKYLLSCDPGVNAVGVCLWDALPGGPPLVGKVFEIGNLLKNWKRLEMTPVERVVVIMTSVDHWLGQWPRSNLVKVVCEVTEQWGGTRGRAAGQDAIYVAVSTGAFVELGRQAGAEVRLVRPSEWKGNLPKGVVAKRLCERYGTPRLREVLESSPEKPSHDWDACGVGAFAKGEFV